MEKIRIVYSSLVGKEHKEGIIELEPHSIDYNKPIEEIILDKKEAKVIK
jgi:hypothetical protein